MRERNLSVSLASEQANHTDNYMLSPGRQVRCYDAGNCNRFELLYSKENFILNSLCCVAVLNSSFYDQIIPVTQGDSCRKGVGVIN